MVDTNLKATRLAEPAQPLAEAAPPKLLRYLISALRRFPSDRGERLEEYEPFPNWESKNHRQAAFEIPLMIKALGLPSGVRILEVGCGRGIGLAGLGEFLSPKRLVGLDIERDLLKCARRGLDAKNIQAELFWADVRRMPFPDASFDIVVDFGTCFHIAHPHRALGEIARVLETGGLFVHETMIAQLFSHPLRSCGRAMPTEWFPQLALHRWRALWTARKKQGSAKRADP